MSKTANALSQTLNIFKSGKKIFDDPKEFDKLKTIAVIAVVFIVVFLILFSIFYFGDYGKQEQDSISQIQSSTQLETSTETSTPLIGSNIDNYATSPNELLDNGINTNGIYYMDIGDGRGVKQYYVNFTLKGGPYVLVAQNMYGQLGQRAIFGVQNVNEPVEDVTKNDNIMPPKNYHFNTDIVTNSIPINKYMVMNCSVDSNNNYIYTYVYFTLDDNSRTKYYQELSDFQGKIWGNSTNTITNKPLPNTYIGKTSGEIITLNNPTVLSTSTNVLKNWNSTDTMVEQHYTGWNSTNGINYIMEVGKSTRGNGLDPDKNLLGFGTQGRNIMIANSTTNIQGTYDWHFINY